MNINGREISSKQPPYVVAEISCNHCGDLGLALRLIEEAKKAGADAVKFQCYTPEEMTLNSDKPDFIIKGGPWKGRKLYDLYEAAYTPREWTGWLFEQGKRFGITVFFSVFSKEGVDFLETFNCPAYKIASMEITDTELIRYVAKTKKPVIVSTGMATKDEILAADWAHGGGEDTLGNLKNFALLHCVSGYPTPVGETNLWKLREFDEYALTFGISDHTQGWEVPVAATALGATIIEKHLRLYKGPESEDSAFSIDELEFAVMCQKVRSIWKATQPSESKSEESSRQLRRSLYVVKDMKMWDRFTKENVRSIRPSYGLPPSQFNSILEKGCATMDISEGTALKDEMIAWQS